MVLDLSDLTFIDATGIHALVRILDAVGTGCLVLRGARPNVLRVFEMTGLTMFRTLKIAPSGYESMRSPHDLPLTLR
jgi:anti-anti-sigma factor